VPAASSLLRFGAFELDLQNNELRRAGVLLKLSPQQFQVLRLLAEGAGQLQSREDIQREVWGTDTLSILTAISTCAWPKFAPR
jgi:DNA-binding response OmpR family regulator